MKLWTALFYVQFLVNHFLSPTSRGRGILVAPGFCLAPRFLVGAKTQKLLVKSFLKF